MFTVMSVLVAAALPLWTQVVKRSQEEELIFRGLQYAEAIRVFQIRTGRYPVQLEELVRVRPRCLRRLWSDPMSDDGKWGLIYAQQAPGAGGRQGRVQGVAPDQQRDAARGSMPRTLGGEESRGSQRRSSRAVAPILGVHSLSDEKAIKDYFGGGKYSDWRFTADVLPVPAVVPGTLNVSRANSRWVGRPFPRQLGPVGGTAPSTAQGRAPEQNRNSRRRSQPDS